MFSLDMIDVAYGDVPILRQISIDVKQGEIVSIVGPNGAGKTTLLRTIAGLLHPLSGSICFRDERIESLEPFVRVERGIVLIPEGRRLFTSMTVMENLELGCYLPRAETVKKGSLERCFELFPVLADRKDQVAGTLSGGEQQMLAIARGLMSVPSLLLLDEPSAGLAPTYVKGLFEAIEQINKGGITILLVEENVVLSLEVCHRAYVLENGSIVAQGTGEEVLRHEHTRKAYMGL